MQMTGRICEIDQKIYSEEQRKLLISDESITIHSLSTIWSAVLDILNDFCHCAQPLFNPYSSGENDDCEQQYDFLDQLEFSTARLSVAKTLLMDLVISSWIKFNRLVKYDDLVRSIPFICPCQVKLFLKILEGTKDAYKQEDTRSQLLSDLLSVMLDYQSKPSMMTMSSRRPGIIPPEPCYAAANQSDLAYFLIWHLYALCTRIKSPSEQVLLANCANILEEAFRIVQAAFLDSLSARRMSPHQEERFKLLFHMLHIWYEQSSQLVDPTRSVNILCLLFKFAQSVDSLANLETKYFDNANFTVDNLTLFQLCTKLFNAAVPMYSRECLADDTTTNVDYAPKQKELVDIWNSMLDRLVQTQPAVRLQ